MIPGVIIGLIAQFKLKSTFHKYSQQAVASGLSGAQAAREILDSAGLSGMPIEEVPGKLTDHYDPIRKKLCLSSENYQGRSVAAVGVAAHEAGHALQHKAAYTPLKFRMALVPITGFATNASIWILIIGWIMSMTPLLAIGVALFAVITLFQIVTLPVEFDASRRAKEQLQRIGIVAGNEAGGVAKVLNAAAMTYVAAMITAVLQLLYWVTLLAGRRE